MKRLRTIAAELIRRKVVRVVGVYLAVYVGCIATAVSIAPAFEIPLHWFKWPIVVGAALIPILAAVAWRYNLVPPQLVRDPKDIENRALGWAAARHDSRDAGSVLLGWPAAESATHQKRFFRPVGIGREATNDIELPDPRVSRYHAVLWAEGGVWRIRDLDSANGTFIDNRRVTGTAALPQACELRFHPTGPSVSVTVTRVPETQVD